MGQKKLVQKRRKAAANTKERTAMTDIVLMPAAEEPQALIPKSNRQSLAAWLQLYMKLDGSACAEQTRVAKVQDLERFLSYFDSVVRSDRKELWTRSVSEGFQKQLKKERSDRTGRKFVSRGQWPAGLTGVAGQFRHALIAASLHVGRRLI